MWPFDRVKTEPKQKEVQANSGTDVAKITNPKELDDFLRDGEQSESFSGERIGLTQAMKVAAVYRCVNILADVAASATINIKDKETFIERSVEDDLIYLLNEVPNKRMPAFDLRRVMDTHKQLKGDGFARVVRGFKRRPIALEFMDYNSVKVREHSDRSLEYKYTRSDGQVLTLPQDEVLHVKGPSFDGITGQSVLTAARNQIGLSVSSEKYVSTFFKNGTNVGSVLENEESLSEEAVEFLKKELDEFRSAEKAHKTLILQGGLKYKPIGMSQADAEFVMGRKLSIIEICMFFGVPPHIVGFNEGQIYGNGVEHTGISFVNYTLNGVFTSWESAIRQTFLGENRREMVELDDSNLLRGDTKSRWDSYKIARETGVMNANDINKLEKRPAIEGGDEYWKQPNLGKGQANEPIDKTA